MRLSITNNQNKNYCWSVNKARGHTRYFNLKKKGTENNVQVCILLKNSLPVQRIRL